MYKDLFFDRLQKVILRIYKMRSIIFEKLNLKESQYQKLVHTDEGKEKLASILKKKPEYKVFFVRLETMDKIINIIREETDDVLPF